MNEEYFEWLLNKAGVDREDHGYSLLCGIMHEMIFYPILGMDENRWEDGVRYRWSFGLEHENNDMDAADKVADYLDDTLGGCTVLELIISVADMMAYEMLDSNYEAGIGKWFDELICNLGLEAYTDQELMENEAAYFEVENVLEKFIFRKYRYDGAGGLFPLHDPDGDQRDEEIAVQMNHYLMENYDILG